METSAISASFANIGLNLLLTCMLLWFLRKLGASGKSVAFIGVAFAGWLAFVVWIFGGHHLISDDIGGLAFFSLLLGAVALVATLFFTTSIGERFSRGGHEWMLMPHCMRAFFGTGFLIQGALGTIPAAFAIADGLTHVTAAVLALWTAWMVGKGYVGRGALWLANLVGLLDIVVVAAGIAFVLLPRIGPYHNVMYAAFFAAPIFIALHLLSLWRLCSGKFEGVQPLGLVT